MKLLVGAILLLSSFTLHAESFVGKFPPQDLGRSAQGEKVSLEDKRGKVVVVSFWASWCKPCLKELPYLEAIQQHVGKERLEIIGVNFKEDRQTFNKIKRQWKDRQITITYDSGGRISKAYQVQAIPHSLIINKDGIVEHQHVGYSEDQIVKMAEELDKLLAQEPQVAAD